MSYNLESEFSKPLNVFRTPLSPILSSSFAILSDESTTNDMKNINSINKSNEMVSKKSMVRQFLGPYPDEPILSSIDHLLEIIGVCKCNADKESEANHVFGPKSIVSSETELSTSEDLDEYIRNTIHQIADPSIGSGDRVSIVRSKNESSPRNSLTQQKKSSISNSQSPLPLNDQIIENVIHLRNSSTLSNPPSLEFSEKSSVSSSQSNGSSSNENDITVIPRNEIKSTSTSRSSLKRKSLENGSSKSSGCNLTAKSNRQSSSSNRKISNQNTSTVPNSKSHSSNSAKSGITGKNSSYANSQSSNNCSVASKCKTLYSKLKSISTSSHDPDMLNNNNTGFIKLPSSEYINGTSGQQSDLNKKTSQDLGSNISKISSKKSSRISATSQLSPRTISKSQSISREEEIPIKTSTPYKMNDVCNCKTSKDLQNKKALFVAKEEYIGDNIPAPFVIKEEWAITKINTFSDKSRTYEVMKPIDNNFNENNTADGKTSVMFAVMPNRTTVCYVSV